MSSGRAVGLHTKLMIDCLNCRANVRIGHDCVEQNWAYNFACFVGLIVSAYSSLSAC